MTGVDITDEMIDRALRRMAEETDLPYMARARDYGPSEPPWSDEQKAALSAADGEALHRNREFMRAVLAAALDEMQQRPEEDER